MNNQPCCSLEAHRRAVRGCIAEPDLGCILESFQLGWRRFPAGLWRFLAEARPYLSPRNVGLAVCVNDPWPTGVLDELRRSHCVTTLDPVWLSRVLRTAEDILESRLQAVRPHLMAFVGQHVELHNSRNVDHVATAWALQLSRDQFSKAQLFRRHLLQPGSWDQGAGTVATSILIDP